MLFVTYGTHLIDLTPPLSRLYEAPQAPIGKHSIKWIVARLRVPFVWTYDAATAHGGRQHGTRLAYWENGNARRRGCTPLCTKKGNWAQMPIGGRGCLKSFFMSA